MIAAPTHRVGRALRRGSRRLDRLGNRALERAHPPLRRAGRAAAPAAKAARAVVAPVLALLALLARR
ncbi:MAG TPA: hypothetical protein VEB65_12465, partial [Solirubrobacterales bacterium]|nr:hypothetical protein [Solirubrobacterales bacterium]